MWGFTSFMSRIGGGASAGGERRPCIHRPSNLAADAHQPNRDPLIDRTRSAEAGSADFDR
jgi:hypothetical protein